MTEHYKKRVSYVFKVEDEWFEITGDSDGEVEIEELAKNGQEDCHRAGVLRLGDNGEWDWFEGRRMFVEYGSKKQADGIVAYLNRHSPPKAE